MMRRPVCLVCLLTALGIWLLSLAGFPLWGTPPVSGELRRLLAHEADVQAVGQIVSWEERNGSSGYLLSRCTITGERESVSCSRIYLLSDCGTLPIGGIVRVRGTLRPPQTSRNPGQFDQTGYYAVRGTNCCLFADTAEVLARGDSVWLRLKEQARQARSAMGEMLRRLLPEQTAGALSAMLLGDQSDLDADLKEDFSQAGVLHILSISGMHLMLLGTICRRLLLRLPIRPKAAAVLSVLLMGAYTVFTGSSAATVRAFWMFSVMMGGFVLGRTYDPLSALAFAALLMLLVRPEYLFYSGFWLSVTAVLGAVLVYPLLFRRERPETDEVQERQSRAARSARRLLRSLEDGAALCGAVTFTMLPATAWCFYEIPLLSLIPNLLIVPTLAWVMLPGLAGCLLGFLHPAAGKAVLLPARALLAGYRLVAETVRKVPGSVWICGQPALWQAAGYYALLALLLFRRSRGNARARRRERDAQKRRGAGEPCTGERPGKRPDKRTTGALLPAVLVLGAACMLLFWRGRREFSLTMLDVGQGESLVLRSGFRTILIDGGSTSESKTGLYRILPYLEQQGIVRLSGIVITHPDEDHVNGILEILAEMGERRTPLRADALFLPAWMRGGAKEERIRTAAALAGVPVRYLQKGDRIRCGRMTLEVLHPEADGENAEYYEEYPNAGSVVLTAECGGFRALLTGDVEGRGEQALLSEVGECDLLKVAHHGSANSTGEELLALVRPEVSLFSCEYPGSYGHPHEELLERLRRCGSRIYGTPVCGAITVWRSRGRTFLAGYLSSEQFRKRPAGS